MWRVCLYWASKQTKLRRATEDYPGLHPPTSKRRQYAHTRSRGSSFLPFSEDPFETRRFNSNSQRSHATRSINIIVNPKSLGSVGKRRRGAFLERYSLIFTSAKSLGEEKEAPGGSFCFFLSQRLATDFSVWKTFLYHLVSPGNFFFQEKWKPEGKEASI